MNFKLLTLVAALAITGCSTTAVTNSDEQVRNQKLATSFVSERVKIETNCRWYKPFKDDCEIVSIEAVGTAPANGNTVMNRKTALIHAGNNARANVAHFIREEINSSRVTSTIAKNVEKAKDKLNTNHGGHDPVEMTDKEANQTNVSVRENSNDTAMRLTSSVKANSSAILRGFYTVKEEVVGGQEVAVTIRWDKTSERTANMLQNKFGNTR